MTKYRVKNVLAIVLFLLLFIFLFIPINDLLLSRIESYKIRNMYTDPDMAGVQVLAMGTSQTMTAYNPALAWDEYHITSYNLGIPGQTVTETYFYLLEALKYCTPQFLVMDIEGIGRQQEFMDESHVKHNLLLMRPSINKYNMIMAVSPDHIFEYILPFYDTHNNWRTLNDDNFTDQYYFEGEPSIKGYYCSGHVASSMDSPLNRDAFGREALPSAIEEYLQKIFTLCTEQGIQVIFVEMPDVARDTEIPFTNQFYAEYQDIYPILDLNSLDIGLDRSHDLRDSKHVNIWGAEKVTRFLAQYILAHYPIDNTITESDATWQSSFQQYEQVKERLSQQ